MPIIPEGADGDRLGGDKDKLQGCAVLGISKYRNGESNAGWPREPPQCKRPS